jgi:Uma2 family endonuclease
MEAWVLTPEEYDALPEDRQLELVGGVVYRGGPVVIFRENDLPLEGRCWELVDGFIHGLGRPTSRHQRVVFRLMQAFDRLKPDNLLAIHDLELRMREDLSRVPDVLVVQARAYDDDQYWYAPDETVLVEVASPHTRLVDRVHKPAEYAQAGVQNYWYIETSPAVEVHTFQLGPPGSYIFTGKFLEGDVVAAPGLSWAKVAVSDLVN